MHPSISLTEATTKRRLLASMSHPNPCEFGPKDPHVGANPFKNPPKMAKTSTNPGVPSQFSRPLPRHLLHLPLLPLDLLLLSPQLGSKPLPLLALLLFRALQSRDRFAQLVV